MLSNQDLQMVRLGVIITLQELGKLPEYYSLSEAKKKIGTATFDRLRMAGKINVLPNPNGNNGKQLVKRVELESCIEDELTLLKLINFKEDTKKALLSKQTKTKPKHYQIKK